MPLWAYDLLSVLEITHQIRELPFHLEKITVWWGLLAGGTIGPYFFKNDAGENVTVNGNRYRAILIDYVMPETETRDFGDIWFQQDDATSHISHHSMDLLREHFGKEIASRFSSVDSPPRSCNITPSDFNLWGYVGSKVYANNIISFQALKQNITRVIRQLPRRLLAYS